MIIEKLVDFIYWLFDTLLIFEIPTLPAQLTTYFEQGMSYIEAGAGILANYTPLAYLLFLLSFVVSIELCIAIYNLVLWICKKIPMAGIS